MAPFNLQGLNVVQPTQNESQELSTPFPDFTAHLDLWTNLAFDTDEPVAKKRRHAEVDEDEDEDEADSPPGLPTQDGHDNAVLPPSVPALDINSLLAGFGIDPLLIPTAPPRNLPPVPTLAQLLALHASQTPSGSAPAPSQSPPSKRPRAQKSAATPVPPSPEDSQPSLSALSAAEEKRRRNTAASARFRLKKKEREAALERRAKELEDRVVELERECEGLRRENGWLKGLVVGVTGAGAAQQQASAK